MNDLPTMPLELSQATSAPSVRPVHVPQSSDASLAETRDLLFAIDPDCSYDTWTASMMAVHDHTGGSSAGIALVDEWSARGRKYKGSREVETKWNSFRSGGGLGIGTLAQLAREYGADLSEIARRHREQPELSDAERRKHAEAARRLVDGQKKETEKAGNFFPFELFGDIDPEPVKEWLVQGLFGVGELIVPYGEPGSGKSVKVGDMGFHIAGGLPWFERRTRQCGVLYVAAERPALVKRRFAALRKHYGIDDLPLAVIGGYFDMSKQKADTDRIIATVAEISKVTASKVGLVIIDTKSQVIGDDNSSTEVPAFVRNVARIQADTGAAVCVVDHSPKHSPSTMRGHTALLGAADTTLLIERSRESDIRTATIVKANDAEDGLFSAFRLQGIALGKNAETGETTTAPVVITADKSEAPAKPGAIKGGRMTPSQKIAMDALVTAITEGGEKITSNHTPANVPTVHVELWREYAYRLGISDTAEGKRKAFQRARKELIERRKVATWDDRVWLVSAEDEAISQAILANAGHGT